MEAFEDFDYNGTKKKIESNQNFKSKFDKDSTIFENNTCSLSDEIQYNKEEEERFNTEESNIHRLINEIDNKSTFKNNFEQKKENEQMSKKMQMIYLRQLTEKKMDEIDEDAECIIDSEVIDF